MSLAVNHLYEFGAFRLDTDERVLRRLDDGASVPITPKVFSILLLLVENQGRILSKEEMMNAIWADTFVEESNLTFNIRKLRQALGDDAHECRYVETISRRGYRFKAEVKKVLIDKSLDAKDGVTAATTIEANGLDHSQRSRTERRNRLIGATLFTVALLFLAGAAAWKYTTGANRNEDGLLSAFAHGAGAMPVLALRTTHLERQHARSGGLA